MAAAGPEAPPAPHEDPKDWDFGPGEGSDTTEEFERHLGGLAPELPAPFRFHSAEEEVGTGVHPRDKGEGRQPCEHCGQKFHASKYCPFKSWKKTGVFSTAPRPEPCVAPPTPLLHPHPASAAHRLEGHAWWLQPAQRQLIRALKTRRADEAAAAAFAFQNARAADQDAIAHTLSVFQNFIAAFHPEVPTLPIAHGARDPRRAGGAS